MWTRMEGDTTLYLFLVWRIMGIVIRCDCLLLVTCCYCDDMLNWLFPAVRRTYVCLSLSNSLTGRPQRVVRGVGSLSSEWNRNNLCYCTHLLACFVVMHQQEGKGDCSCCRSLEMESTPTALGGKFWEVWIHCLIIRGVKEQRTSQQTKKKSSIGGSFFGVDSHGNSCTIWRNDGDRSNDDPHTWYVASSWHRISSNIWHRERERRSAWRDSTWRAVLSLAALHLHFVGCGWMDGYIRYRDTNTLTPIVYEVNISSNMNNCVWEHCIDSIPLCLWLSKSEHFVRCSFCDFFSFHGNSYFGSNRCIYCTVLVQYLYLSNHNYLKGNSVCFS